MNTHVLGTFLMMKYGTLAMSKNQPDDNGEKGVIINISSCMAY
jgi:3-hydroxyacyl-CoA dehydrogenase/3-hydroxy-2-methylbutyryl-CoA dehydrogenase